MVQGLQGRQAGLCHYPARAGLQEDATVKVELEGLGSVEAAYTGIKTEGTPDPFPLHFDTAHDHDPNHCEVPKKVSFPDWTRWRQRGTQAAESKDLVAVSMDEAGTLAPDACPAGTEVELSSSNSPSLPLTAPDLTRL
ncbi:hypothetical protein FRC08_007861 [Ceratobasidium sp. 394]|nr:hypothetical protein FRC08_007861 [Ceratobasidium sp. 394]